MEERRLRSRRRSRAERHRRRRRTLTFLFTLVLGVTAITAGVLFIVLNGRRTRDRAALRDVPKTVEKLAFPGDDGTGWRPREENGGGPAEKEQGTAGEEDGNSIDNSAGNSTGDSLEDKLRDMTLEERVLQMFYVTPESLTGVREVYAAGTKTENALKEYPVGGIVYFKQNLRSPDQVKDMLVRTQKYAKSKRGIPVFLGVDEEGGQVARITGRTEFNIPAVKDMKDIGATGNPGEAYAAGEKLGSALAELGFNMDFAPVADVLTNPENTVVARRSFGEDGPVVAEFVKAEMAGLKAKGIHPVLKHFPGHGGTAQDSHQEYAYTERTLEQLMEEDLVPFKEGIDAGADFVMTAHIAAPQVTGNDIPATLSRVLTTEVLREKLQFNGVIITDALNMKAVTERYSSAEAAVAAVQAGADMLLMPENFTEAYQGVLEAVRNGTIPEERINESVRRVLKVKLGK